MLSSCCAIFHPIFPLFHMGKGKREKGKGKRKEGTA
jgi:hypothetical protein